MAVGVMMMGFSKGMQREVRRLVGGYYLEECLWEEQREGNKWSK